MTSQTEHPITRCSTLQEAWDMVCAMQLSCGIITLMSDGVNGGFAFMDGRIVGAFVDETGARGEEALNVLSGLPRVRCDFMPFNRESVREDASHMRDVITTSEPVLTGDREGGPGAVQVQAQTAPADGPAQALLPNAPLAAAVQTEQVDASNFASNFASTVELPAFASRQGITPPAPPPPPPPSPATAPLDPLAERRSRIPISPVVASTLFKHFVAAENLQEFLHEELVPRIHEESSLNEAQLRLLDIVRELTDPELFEEQSEVDLKDATSLSTLQKERLKAFEGVTNPVEFVRRTGQLDFEGLQITDEQLVELGQLLAARTLPQQQEEFAQESAELKSNEETQLKDFIEPEAPDVVAEGEQNQPALGRVGFASDFTNLNAVEVDMHKAKFEGPEGVAGGAGEYERPPVTEWPYTKYVAPAVVFLLCVAVFTLPALLHATTAADAVEPKVAYEQTKILVNDEIRAQSPRNQRPAAGMPAASSPPVTNGTPQVTEPSDNDPLAEARTASAEGNLAKAIAILEEALSSNPAAVDTRIELIKLYKAQKKLKRARELAVIGFRLPGNTPKQRDDLWDLYMACCERKPHP